MICTGANISPNIPLFPGLKEEFQGDVMHTHALRDPRDDRFKDKNVLVVGAGNSSADAAVELSTTANKVFLYSREGAWVVSRTDDDGMPLDVKVTRRWLLWAMNVLPERLMNMAVDVKLTGRETRCLRPRSKFLQEIPVVNDDIHDCVSREKVLPVQGEIGRFLFGGVNIVDRTTTPATTTHLAIDAVILGTGYSVKFPFLKADFLSAKNNNLSLYKSIFPSHHRYHSLAVIGCVTTNGATIPVIEMQARAAVHVFRNRCPLPSQSKMEEEIEKRRLMNTKRYRSPRLVDKIDQIPYMDELAEMIGVKPNFMFLALWDRPLLRACLFGPAVSYQYRISGPNAWKGAREAVLKSFNRDSDET
jgi:dimethylaniline monooxygenase (N-oxide forming)